MPKPMTFHDLQVFYQTEYRPLYKAFETWKGILPILETFEDHITSDALIRGQKASRRARMRKIVYDIGLALFGALVGTLFGVFISR